MQAIVETLFDTVYLISVITIGILMIRGSKGDRQFRLFGWMAVVLGAGDSFHLVPRVLALCTTGLENYTVPLGIGKWITSVTMTIFYVLLYYVWRQRYKLAGCFTGNLLNSTVSLEKLYSLDISCWVSAWCFCWCKLSVVYRCFASINII